jgi:hypothetical protein
VVESLLAPDVDQGLYKFHEQFKNEVNVDGKIKEQFNKYRNSYVR